VKLIRLSFGQNPAEYTARYIEEGGIHPLNLLIISPTQRFKTYFASFLLKLKGNAQCISPFILTSAQLIHSLVSSRGLFIANELERLSMLSYACRRTEEMNKIFPGDVLQSWVQFRGASRRIFRSFEELAREEVPLMDAVVKESIADQSPQSKEHFEVLQALYKNYAAVQEELESWDKNCLISGVKDQEIERFFEEYEEVVLVSPLSLTGFEKRIFQTVGDKLTVLYQDTEEYDFSDIITYREERGGPIQKKPAAGAQLRFFEASSRMDEVMICLALIEDEIAAGISPHKIAVMNIDSLFCEMLYNSLSSIGIEANYSEGIQVKKSPVFQFLQLIQAFFASGLDAQLFLEIVRNEFFQELSGAALDYRDTKRKIVRYRMFKLSSLSAELITSDPRAVEAFADMKRIYDSESFMSLYEGLLLLFSRLGRKKTYEFYTVQEILLSTAFELNDLRMDVKESAFEIFLYCVKLKKFPLLGTVKRGVQIIGLLESRGITFQSVIVPSFNEGFFPVPTENDIFLSLSTRRKLGLSTFLEREELEYYYLRRVIDASDHTFIISIADRTGEIDVKSRFYLLLEGFREKRDLVGQGRYVLPVSNVYHGDQGKRSILAPPSIASPILNFSRLDIERIKRCEIQYYIAKILHVRDEEEIRKEIELNVVGQKVHAIFHELYRDMDANSVAPGRGGDRKSVNGNYKGGEVPAFGELKKKLIKLFEDSFRDGSFFTREEALMKKIVRKNLLKCLEKDIQRFENGHRVCSEYSEREFSAVLGPGGIRYTLQGRIDRIDRTPSGGFLIIDYKTGSLPTDKEHSAASGFQQVQLGLYGLLFQKNHSEARIEGLCYFDVNNKNDIVEVIGSKALDVYLAEFENHLIELIEAFNGKERLSLTDDLNHCIYCPYSTICRVFEQ